VAARAAARELVTACTTICATWGWSDRPGQSAHHRRDAWADRGVDRRAFAALAELRAQGLVRHVGLSNVTAAQVAEAQAIAPVACVQNHYNLVHRADDALIDSLAARASPMCPSSRWAGSARSSRERCRRWPCAGCDADAGRARLAAPPRPNILLIPAPRRSRICTRTSPRPGWCCGGCARRARHDRGGRGITAPTRHRDAKKTVQYERLIG
jgi:hypothetical protein